jgi:transposase-like protein
MSASAFCRQENIAPGQFYYWSRRVRESAGQDVSGNHRLHERQSTTTEHTVELFIGSDVKVRLPVGEPELIKCVLSGLQSATQSTARPSLFERIDLGDKLAARR